MSNIHAIQKFTLFLIENAYLIDTLSYTALLIILFSFAHYFHKCASKCKVKIDVYIYVSWQSHSINAKRKRKNQKVHIKLLKVYLRASIWCEKAAIEAGSWSAGTLTAGLVLTEAGGRSGGSAQVCRWRANELLSVGHIANLHLVVAAAATAGGGNSLSLSLFLGHTSMNP
jgi:hypothetical protein